MSSQSSQVQDSASTAQAPPTKQAKVAEVKDTAGAPAKKDLLPVTLLSGFLGAGKTTLLKQILRNKQGLKIAVIVNDMGSINIDANEVVKHKLVQEKQEMVELHNGCICCTLRGDLLKTVKELAEAKEFDYLVIESTGIAEPLPVAQTFVMDVNGGGFEHDHDHDHDHDGDDHDHDNDNDTKTVANFEPLLNYARMDTLVTVLDSFNFLPILSSVESEADREKFLGPEEVEEDDASIVQLLMDQIEFANVIILNKFDLLQKQYGGANSKSGETAEGMLTKIRALIAKLNPKAQIVIPPKPYFEEFDVAQVLNTNKFDMDEAQTSAGWLHELAKPQHTPETEEYGISSIVFRSHDRPFHSGRLAAIFEGFGKIDMAATPDDDAATDAGDQKLASAQKADPQAFAGVVRCKGLLWLANADACRVDMHSVGRQLELVPGEPWMGKVAEMCPHGDPAAQQPSDLDTDAFEQHQMAWEAVGLTNEVIAEMKAKEQWTDKFGDRHSEVVFIGIKLKKALLRQSLTDALLTDAEMAAGKDAWGKIEDPFFSDADGNLMDLELQTEDSDAEVEADADANADAAE